MQPGALVVGPMIYWLCWVSVIKFEGLKGEHKEIKGKIKKYGEMCVFKIAHHKIHIKHNEQQFVCGSVAEENRWRTSTPKDATKWMVVVGWKSHAWAELSI